MTGFSESPEYKAQQMGNVELSVQDTLLLGRAPTDGEATYAVPPLQSGAVSPASLADRLLMSGEYTPH